MIKKINKWLDTPITWRASFKMTGIAYLVLIPIMLICYIDAGVIDNPIDKIKEKFDKKESRKEEEEA